MKTEKAYSKETFRAYQEDLEWKHLKCDFCNEKVKIVLKSKRHLAPICFCFGHAINLSNLMGDMGD